MLVTLTRTGGFTGIPLRKTVDTSQLPADRAKKVEEKTQDLFSKENLEKRNPLPDQFTYIISVDDGVRKQSTTFDESSMPDSLKELIQIITSLT